MKTRAPVKTVTTLPKAPARAREAVSAHRRAAELYRSLTLASGSFVSSLEWLDEALIVVRNLALRRRTFTTDDLWDILAPPGEPRLMGRVLRNAAREGIIKATSRHMKSRRQRRPALVWRSSICG